MPVVIKNSSKNNYKNSLGRFGRTIVDGTGFVNSRLMARRALKPLEKALIWADITRFSFKQKQTLRIARNLLLILLALLLLPYLLAPLYRFGHPVSTLMAWRWLTGAPMSRQWVDLAAMSPALPRSVVGSEDAKFCIHHGIDWDALRGVIDDAEDGEVTRGGSTITQQVAKNLFLWQGRSVVRKALELPLALWIDLVLPKRRILEIYLNVAELGPAGQFGAETGAVYAFGRPASALSSREAALMAAILPNPVRRSARNPGQGVRRLSGIYMVRAQDPALPRCWGENRTF